MCNHLSDRLVLSLSLSHEADRPAPGLARRRRRVDDPTVQVVLTCTDGVDSWTTTKDFCPDWFCPDAVMIWVAAYSEADGLQLSVVQSRTCSKEESCAAGGHDDNDDHSDGAAKLGPLAALFIAAITITTL